MNPITMNLVADDIIRFALREDMNAGDLSTESVCPGPRKAEVQLIAKASGVIAGLDVFERTFALLDPATSFEALVADGDEVTAGQLLGTVRGDARVQFVEVEGMEPIPAELVIVSCGVRANSEVFQKAGGTVERAIVVDEQMRTNLPDVFACGDCAQYQGLNTALWAQATLQGRVAGANAAAASK